METGKCINENTMAFLSKNNNLYKLPEKPKFFHILETFGAFTAALSFFCIGNVRSWTSPGIYSIQTDPSQSIVLAASDSTWIASSIPVGAFFGTILGAPMLQYCGRKKTIAMLTIPYIGGWLLIGLAKNVTMVIVGRALTGFAVGLSTAAAQLYVSESSRSSVRGVLGLMPAMMLAVGILTGFSIGTWTNWRTSALIMSAFPSTLLLFSLILPETPLWLVMHNREEDARHSLLRLRGADQVETIEQELKEIKECLQEGAEEPPNLYALLRKREIWLPLVLVLTLMMFQQLCGISVIIYYLKVILRDSKVHSDKSSLKLPLDIDFSILVFGLTHFLAFFISIPLIDRGGRKVLLICSAACMCIAHIALGIYFIYGAQNNLQIISQTGTWLPLTALCSFIAAYSIGFASVPYIIMSEVFPSKIRSYLCSIVTLNEQIFCFAVVQIFPLLKRVLEPCYIFWMFALFCLLSIFLVVFAIPETKGKSLAELEKLFKKTSETSGIDKEDYVVVVSNTSLRVQKRVAYL